MVLNKKRQASPRLAFFAPEEVKAEPRKALLLHLFWLDLIELYSDAIAHQVVDLVWPWKLPRIWVRACEHLYLLPLAFVDHQLLVDPIICHFLQLLRELHLIDNVIARLQKVAQVVIPLSYLYIDDEAFILFLLQQQQGLRKLTGDNFLWQFLTKHGHCSLEEAAQEACMKFAIKGFVEVEKIVRGLFQQFTHSIPSFANLPTALLPASVPS